MRLVHQSRIGPFIGLAAMLFTLPCALVGASDFKLDPIRPQIVSARLPGFGGSYSALEAGFDTLSTNPAALAYVSHEWSIARLAAQISGPLFDLSSALQSSDIATGLLDLVGDNNGIYMGANITGPIAFGKVDRNFGFGLFNRTITSADVPSLSRGTLIVGEEFLLTGGYGLSVFEKGPHSIAVGLQLKGFFQNYVYEKDTAVSVLNDLTSLSTNSLPAALSTGFGLDVGVLYRFGPDLSVGLTCKDLYTPVFTSQYENYQSFMNGSTSTDSTTQLIDPDLSAGVAYSIPLPESWVTISDWKVMADYRDVLDLLNPVYRNPVLNFAVGSELVLLDVVSLRAGISETYLATGIGVDLKLCKIDFAMFGSELGLDPGKRPLLNLALSLSFEY
jgi:hypothetical protein